MWEAAKFLSDSHFKFFAAFARGILGSVMSGPAIAVTSIGAAAPSLAAPAPWAAAQHSAASPCQQSAVPALHAPLAHGGRAARYRSRNLSHRPISRVLRCGALFPHFQPAAAGPGPMSGPGRAAVAGGSQGNGGRSRLIGWEAGAEGPPTGRSLVQRIVRATTICGR